jgi:hypothetical protein
VSLLSSLSFGLSGDAARPRALGKLLARWALLALGSVLMVVGLIGAVLPGHLGVPVLVVGLIIVLRTSRPARRQFVGLQRRHPKLVFPLRRLLRREPEVMPVAWQQALRFEKLIVPRKWRQLAGWRRKYLRKRRGV